MKKILLILCVVLIVLAGCGPSRKAIDAREDSILNQWLKQPKSLLVRQWGQPDSLMSDGRNGEILIYKEGIDFLSVMNERYTGKQGQDHCLRRQFPRKDQHGDLLQHRPRFQQPLWTLYAGLCHHTVQ